MTVTPTRDLRSAFGAARNQGFRPTCCAFACSDVHAANRSPWVDLSCEYAFYHGARRQGSGPGGGVYLNHMLDAVEQDGQPVEADWPYLATVPSDLALWTPPTGIGHLYYAVGARSAGNVAAVRAEIDQDRPVVIVMSLSNAFYLGPNGGGVIDSDEPVELARTHALIAVGHGMLGADGFTLVRNSWGHEWGASGHAWLSDRYLSPRIIEIATVTLVK